MNARCSGMLPRMNKQEGRNAGRQETATNELQSSFFFFCLPAFLHSLKSLGKPPNKVRRPRESAHDAQIAGCDAWHDSFRWFSYVVRIDGYSRWSSRLSLCSCALSGSLAVLVSCSGACDADGSSGGIGGSH